MVEAQKWLDQNYSNKEKIKWIEKRWGEGKISGELIIDDFPQLKEIHVGKNQLTQLHLNNCPQLTKLNCKDNNLAELTITNCPRLTELNCSNSKLTSLDVSNNPDLLSLYCDFPLYPNIIGLENTSIIKLDVREGISKGEISDPQEIWKILTDIRKKHFPEMKLIDISDLDQLAAQVNKKTANNPKFLTKICPSDPELFTKTQKGNFYWIFDQLANRILARVLILQNRLHEGKDEKWEKEINDLSLEYLECHKMNPKNPAAAYIPTRQKCGLNANQTDPELVERVKDLSWIDWSKSKTKNYEKQPKQKTPTKDFEANKTSEASEISSNNQEKSQLQQTITNHQNKIQQLETQLTNLESQKQTALTNLRQEIQQQQAQEKNNLREKVNSKLANRLFAPNEKGKTLEQAIDNLLEKENKLTNKITELEREIGRTSLELSREKEIHQQEKNRLKNTINVNLPWNKRGNNLEEAVNIFVREKTVNEYHIPTFGDKCVNVVAAPFRWTANKVGTGLALTGFMTVGPTLLMGLGWMIKVFVNVKTGGAVGTMEVANSLLNQGGQSGHNIPPLPQPQGGYLPPQAIHASSPNPQPVINNHYHVASKKKKNDLEEKVNLVKFPN